MEIVPATELDDAALGSALALQQADEVELDPDIPPITADEFGAYLLHDQTENADHDRLVAVDGGRVRALGHLERHRSAERAEFSSAEIYWENEPAAYAVLEAMLDRAEADGRTTLMGWGLEEEEHAFWSGAGADLRYVERISRLDLAETDASLMDQWITGRDERASEFSLLRWVGPTPDDRMANMIDVKNAMNDAPLEDLDVDDEVATESSVRTDEQSWIALGQEPWIVMALAPDGETAGYTAVMVNTFRPSASWQWDTVVLDRFRERGIGRWLKAEMWRWLRQERPAVDRLRTGNAESNDAMLGINVAMGFRPAYRYGGWQADISTYRARLHR